MYLHRSKIYYFNTIHKSISHFPFKVKSTIEICKRFQTFYPCEFSVLSDKLKDLKHYVVSNNVKKWDKQFLLDEKTLHFGSDEFFLFIGRNQEVPVVYSSKKILFQVKFIIIRNIAHTEHEWLKLLCWCNLLKLPVLCCFQWEILKSRHLYVTKM